MSTPISLRKGYLAATSSGLPLPQPRSMNTNSEKSMARFSSGVVIAATGVVS
jgi:hypothetical protein